MNKFEKELQHLLKLMSTMHHRGLIFHKHRIKVSLFLLKFYTMKMSKLEKKECIECIYFLRNIINSPADNVYKAMFANRCYKNITDK